MVRIQSQSFVLSKTLNCGPVTTPSVHFSAAPAPKDSSGTPPRKSGATPGLSIHRPSPDEVEAGSISGATGDYEQRPTTLSLAATSDSDPNLLGNPNGATTDLPPSPDSDPKLLALGSNGDTTGYVPSGSTPNPDSDPNIVAVGSKDATTGYVASGSSPSTGSKELRAATLTHPGSKNRFDDDDPDAEVDLSTLPKPKLTDSEVKAWEKVKADLAVTGRMRDVKVIDPGQAEMIIGKNINIGSFVNHPEVKALHPNTVAFFNIMTRDTRLKDGDPQSPTMVLWNNLTPDAQETLRYGFWQFGKVTLDQITEDPPAVKKSRFRKPKAAPPKTKILDFNKGHIGDPNTPQNFAHLFLSASPHFLKNVMRVDKLPEVIHEHGLAAVPLYKLHVVRAAPSDLWFKYKTGISVPPNCDMFDLADYAVKPSPFKLEQLRKKYAKKSTVTPLQAAAAFLLLTGVSVGAGAALSNRGGGNANNQANNGGTALVNDIGPNGDLTQKGPEITQGPAPIKPTVPLTPEEAWQRFITLSAQRPHVQSNEWTKAEPMRGIINMNPSQNFQYNVSRTVEGADRDVFTFHSSLPAHTTAYLNITDYVSNKNGAQVYFENILGGVNLAHLPAPQTFPLFSEANNKSVKMSLSTKKASTNSLKVSELPSNATIIDFTKATDNSGFQRLHALDAPDRAGDVHIVVGKDKDPLREILVLVDPSKVEINCPLTAAKDDKNGRPYVGYYEIYKKGDAKNRDKALRIFPWVRISANTGKGEDDTLVRAPNLYAVMRTMYAKKGMPTAAFPADYHATNRLPIMLGEAYEKAYQQWDASFSTMEILSAIQRRQQRENAFVFPNFEARQLATKLDGRRNGLQVFSPRITAPTTPVAAFVASPISSPSVPKGSRNPFTVSTYKAPTRATRRTKGHKGKARGQRPGKNIAATNAARFKVYTQGQKN